MKKAYMKPQIVFDSFVLTEDIAAGCTLLNSNMQPYVCAVLDQELGFTIFSDYEFCDSTPPGGNDTVCYHVPTADWNVFSS